MLRSNTPFGRRLPVWKSSHITDEVENRHGAHLRIVEAMGSLDGYRRPLCVTTVPICRQTFHQEGIVRHSTRLLMALGSISAVAETGTAIAGTAGAPSALVRRPPRYRTRASPRSLSGQSGS